MNKIIGVSLTLLATNVSAFDVYGHFPHGEILYGNGVKKVDVVYENRFMTNGKADLVKIKKVAIGKQTRFVSFDNEFGTRWKPETVLPETIRSLKIFRQYNKHVSVGCYATLPTNTYGWDIKRAKDAMALNKKYASLIQHVNVLSPVLYNYNGHDHHAWLKAARFNIAEAKKYKGRAKINAIIYTIKISSPIDFSTAYYRDRKSTRLNSSHRL